MEKYGFVYLWFDRKHKRYYVGSHWGHEKDKYVCSSSWMMQAYKRRRNDFKRRTLKIVFDRKSLYLEETRWLKMIKESEISPNAKTPRYYNLNIWGAAHWSAKDDGTVAERISQATKGIPKPKSEAHRKALSESQKGKPKRRVQTQEEKDKRAAKLRGGKMPPRGPEYREKQRQAKLGKTPANKGIPQSDAARAKFQETMRLKRINKANGVS